MVEQLNGEVKARLMQENNNVFLNNGVNLHRIQKKLEQCREAVIRDVEKRILCVIEDVMDDIRQQELNTSAFKDFAQSSTNIISHRVIGTWNNRVITRDESEDTNVNIIKNDSSHTSKVDNDDKKIEKILSVSNKKDNCALPDKIFITRNSYLTALLEVDHMKSIYHIFYTIFVVFMLNGICHDFFVQGRVNFGLNTFKIGFGKIHNVLGIWLLQHIFLFSLYYAFKGWAIIQYKFRIKPKSRALWNYSCLLMYASSQFIFGYIASILCLKLDLPFVTSAVLLLESSRLLMKMHAFVRTNCPRVLHFKIKDDDNQKEYKSSVPVYVPSFKCYLYFLFAPTLIYKDSYPRTRQIRWKFALARIMEVVAIAFLYSYIHERYIRIYYSNFGLEELNASKVIVRIFGMMMPSAVILLCGFYLLLHSWLNFTSELLRFGDRMFYKDWWTAYTYEAYYRNWNVVVHDWLYEYIYKDAYMYIFRRSKLAASLAVFAVSALVHEHIMGFALKVFFPVLFVFFAVFGVAMVFVTRRLPKGIGNFLVWFTLITGNGLIVSLYCMEYYASLNCPKNYINWKDYLKPAMWNCYR